MADKHNKMEGIQAIDAITVIQTRPELYIGPLDSPAAINTLLVETLCIALDNAISGCASEVEITIHADGSASVRDNGPGLNIEIVHDGLTAIEILLTQLYACREAKRNKVNKALCGVGIVVTNALSSKLTVETVHDGWIWQQHYSYGRAKGPIQKVEETSQQWQKITFHPNPAIFGTMRLSPDYFAEWFAQQSLGLGEAVVTLHYDRTFKELHAGS